MNKIPTVFQRDPEDRAHVLPIVTPGCEWVLAGEGQATRKYDGTCVQFDEDGRWWARREVKRGKTPPAGFVSLSTDEVTGKTVGWEPVEQSGFTRWHAEALISHTEVMSGPWVWRPGTYELIGPKVNGNPERKDRHWLVEHAEARPILLTDLTFEGIRARVLLEAELDGCEGIVWHHPDGRMAKIKARDFTPGADS